MKVWLQDMAREHMFKIAIVSASGCKKFGVIKEISNISGTFVMGIPSCYPVCIEVIHDYSDNLTMPSTPFLI